MAGAVDRAFHAKLASSRTFADFFAEVKREIAADADGILARIRDMWFIPSPFYGLCFPFDDISTGGKYNNLGLHGTGVATAADSLSARDSPPTKL